MQYTRDSVNIFHADGWLQASNTHIIHDEERSFSVKEKKLVSMTKNDRFRLKKKKWRDDLHLYLMFGGMPAEYLHTMALHEHF